MKWVEWRDEFIRRLRDAETDDPSAEFREIIARVAGKRGAFLLFEKSDQVEDLLSQDEIARVGDAVARRCAREPLDYIFNETFFYRDSFAVGPGVLVPRQDSELLVSAALRALGVDTNFLFGRLEDIPALSSTDRGGPIRIFDLCTGTGCVGISIANVLSGYLVSYRAALTERYGEAAAYASKNIEMAREPDLIRLFMCDIYPAKAELESWWGNEPADLIVANPPYIADAQIDGLMPEVSKFEPREALSGGSDGLSVYRRILERVGEYLRPGGMVLFEHGYDQKDALATLLTDHAFTGAICIKDFGDQDRVTAAVYRPTESKGEKKDGR
ncbi:MAG: peptide chain release factor N(5)-glutamine methyltransferase [Oscillospiraceae bacterium]|nr:peptide chain release factor N(5)-glutamine methyltransferase [Oscillospiraceae bacterium]